MSVIPSIVDSKRSAAMAEKALKQRAIIESLDGPVRIRSVPQDRDLKSEQEEHADQVAYHFHRNNEEIAAIQQKFAKKRKVARSKLNMQLAKLNAMFANTIANLPDSDVGETLVITRAHSQKLDDATKEYRNTMYHLSAEVEAYDIKQITYRRSDLAFMPPNDGQAHPFTWKGVQYHRTYKGEMWRTDGWIWAGYWTGYYIASGNPPQDDIVSEEIREAFRE